MKGWVKTRVPGAARVVRWFYHLADVYRTRPRYYLSRAPFLEGYDFDLLYFDGRGNHPEQHLARTKKYLDLHNADLLVVGCRYGNELPLWLEQKPRSVVAFDYFSFKDDWDRLKARYPQLRIDFLAADAHYLPFAANSFDLVLSDNVLEHLNSPALSIREMHRVLRPEGLMFAGFIPLFWTYGGAHFEGEFEHLLYPRDKFYRWIVERNRTFEQNECRHYLDHNMFSYWTIDQYLDAFKQFDRKFIVLHLSRQAYGYRDAHPNEWAILTQQYPEKQLLMSGATVWLKKVMARSSR